MRFNFNKLLMSGALVFAALLSVSTRAAAQTWVPTFTIVNSSHIRIDELYVKPNNSIYWGDNRLVQDVLHPGYYSELPVLGGWYDVKLVDKDGLACVVRDVDIRSSDKWTITDVSLTYCELLGGK